MKYNLQREPLWKLVLVDALLICVLLSVFTYFHLFRTSVYQEISDHVRPAEGGIDIISETVSEGDVYENGLFTKDIVKTDNKYTSPNVSVEIIDGTYTSGKISSDYHLADIYIKDMTCFRSVFAKDAYGRGITEKTLDAAVRTGAVCAINGDYYGTSERNLIIRNGEQYGLYPKGNDICVLYLNGAMAVYDSKGFNANEAIENGAWQAWSFGPGLLDDEGNPLTSFKSSVKNNHPRSVVGCFEPGHYCFLAVDGRSNRSAGLTLSQLAMLCSELGMTCAYNLDGGRTTVMTFFDKVVNEPVNNGRYCSDFLGIFELADQ